MMKVCDGRSGVAGEIKGEETKGMVAAVSVEALTIQRRLSMLVPRAQVPHSWGIPSQVWATPALGRKIGLDSKPSLEELLETHTSCKFLSSRVLTWLPVTCPPL